MSRNHLSYGYKTERQKTAFACLMFEICNGIFTCNLCILNRGQAGLGNPGRENDTHNLIPEGMNSRGTNKQANKIFFCCYNTVATAQRDEKKILNYGEAKGSCGSRQCSVRHWAPITSSAHVPTKKCLLKHGCPRTETQYSHHRSWIGPVKE